MSNLNSGMAIVAIAIPVIIVILRNEVRRRRIRLILGLQDSFGFGSTNDAKQPCNFRNCRQSSGNPSFEFAKSKYTYDVTPPKSNPSITSKIILELRTENVEAVEYVLKRPWFLIGVNWNIIFASIPFMLVSFIGFFIVFNSNDYLLKFFNEMGNFPLFFDVDFPVNDPVGWHSYVRNNLVVVSVAFCGSYIFSITLFLRALANFDLSPITFLRAALHIVFAVLGTLIIFKAMPTIGHALSLANWEATPFPQWMGNLSDPAVALKSGIPFYWYILAFVFSFSPDGITRYLFDAAISSRVISAIKRINPKLVDAAKSVPLDLIDGIDAFTRFRLEEANISEVQGLATANPILLHVETPYGIYQTVDWVAQAQLCTIVGPERFLLLREYNIRTIFDIERAVLSKLSTSQLRRLVGSILFMPTAQRDAVVNAIDGGLPKRFPILQQGTGGATITLGTLAEFDASVIRAIAEQPRFDVAIGATVQPDMDETILHMVYVILDDLHVRRLRQIWELIERALGNDSASFDDWIDRRMPTDPPQCRCPEGPTRTCEASRA